MRHPTRAGIGLVRLGDSDFVPQTQRTTSAAKTSTMRKGNALLGAWRIST
jgi:hypothetical protein